MSKELIEAFVGPRGRAEVYEVVTVPDGELAMEIVEYEIILDSQESRTVKTMGEAAILAAELSGDGRFQTPST